MKHIPVRKIHIQARHDSSSASLRIRSIEDSMTDHDRDHGTHRHEFYFVLIVIRGSGTHEVDFVTYDVQDHSVFVLRPGQVHRLTLAPSCTGYLVEFAPSFVHHYTGFARKLFRRVSQRSHALLTPDSIARLTNIVGDMQHEQSMGLLGSHEAIHAHFTLFVTELARASAAPNSDAPDHTPIEQERFEELIYLIEHHLAEWKLPSDYARGLHISLYQLNALARSMVGRTCSELINEHIIVEAKRQLLATSAQVKEIGYLLGYDDPSYFIRFFKKHTGHSPDAFRKQHR